MEEELEEGRWLKDYLYHKVYIDLLLHHLSVSAKERRFGSPSGPDPEPPASASS